MKSVKSIALAVLLLAGPIGQVVGQGFTGHTYLEGRNFMRDGVPFYPIVMNYSIEFMTDVVDPIDTDMVRLSAAGAYDMNYVHIECDDQPECDAQLLAHFAKLQQMGFNTVRLTGQRLRLTKDQFGEPVLSYGIRLDDWYVDPYLRTMVGPTFTDQWSLKFFNSFKRLLDLATTAGLNVIFLVSPASVEVGTADYYAIDEQPGRDLVAQFLTRLTEELHLRPSLMAIDLINEPIWMHKDQHLAQDLTKQDVCDITTQWYDAIHAGSAPYPLVTLGGYGAAEAGSWDPAVMKIDFYSPHVYPEPTAVTDHDVQSTTDRVNAEIHWLGMTCPLPWLIGETAFSADDDTVDPMGLEFNWTHHLDVDLTHHTWPYMDGSESEQASFASSTLSGTRAALGSGYSWWGFQNDRFGGEGTLPGTLIQADHKPYLSNFFGVLKYGNMAGGPAPWNTARPWRDKQVVGAFQSADQSPINGAMGVAPVNYYNWHNLTTSVINSGTVYDQNNLPVSHGIVEVAWPGYTPNSTAYAPEGFFDRIPLDASGHYDVRLAPSSLSTPLGVVYSQAPGSRMTKLHVSGGESISVPHISNAVLNVEVDRMPFERQVQSETYGLSDQDALDAWSTITLYDVVAQGNGTTGAQLDVRARDAIHVTGETHFQIGSEVYLRAEQAFPDCGSTAYHMMLPTGSQRLQEQPANRADRVKKIELGFELPEIEVLQDVGGGYAVFISHSGPGSWQVFDGSGRLVWMAGTPIERVQCETTAFARDEYTVLWQSGTFRRSKQFIRP
jgi:hypothetical protein